MSGVRRMGGGRALRPRVGRIHAGQLSGPLKAYSKHEQQVTFTLTPMVISDRFRVFKTVELPHTSRETENVWNNMSEIQSITH